MNGLQPKGLSTIGLRAYIVVIDTIEFYLQEVGLGLYIFHKLLFALIGKEAIYFRVKFAFRTGTDKQS